MSTSNYETVTIPTTSNPYRVIVNGVEYKYEAGATVEVPPEVAAAINASVNAASDLVKPSEVKPPFGASGGSDGSIPKPLSYDYMPEGYPRKERKVVFEEADVAFSAGQWGGYIAEISMETLGAGTRVYMSIDGTTFDFILEDAGNRIFGGNEECNFVQYEGEPTYLGTNKEGNTHRIKIVAEVSEPFDETFLPVEAVGRAVGRAFGGTVLHVSFDSEQADKTYEEVLDATRAGFVVGHKAGRTFIATQNYYDGVFRVDFWRLSHESLANSGVPTIEVYSLNSDESITETQYPLATE